jgi:hypothetical protein
MSERVNRQQADLLEILKKSAIALAVNIIITLVISSVLSLLLLLSGQPEAFYDYASVLVLALSTYLTVRIYLCKNSSKKILTAMLFSVLTIAFIALTSLIFVDNLFALKSFLINCLIVLAVSFLASVSCTTKNRRKKSKKRK